MEEEITEETLDILRAEICVVLYKIVNRCPDLKQIIPDNVSDESVHKSLTELCDYLQGNCRSSQKKIVQWIIISEFREAFQKVPLLKALFKSKIDPESVCQMLLGISFKIKTDHVTNQNEKFVYKRPSNEKEVNDFTKIKKAKLDQQSTKYDVKCVTAVVSNEQVSNTLGATCEKLSRCAKENSLSNEQLYECLSNEEIDSVERFRKSLTDSCEDDASDVRGTKSCDSSGLLDDKSSNASFDKCTKNSLDPHKHNGHSTTGPHSKIFISNDEDLFESANVSSEELPTTSNEQISGSFKHLENSSNDTIVSSLPLSISLDEQVGSSLNKTNSSSKKDNFSMKPLDQLKNSKDSTEDYVSPDKNFSVTNEDQTVKSSEQRSKSLRDSDISSNAALEDKCLIIKNILSDTLDKPDNVGVSISGLDLTATNVDKEGKNYAKQQTRDAKKKEVISKKKTVTTLPLLEENIAAEMGSANSAVQLDPVSIGNNSETESQAFDADTEASVPEPVLSYKNEIALSNKSVNKKKTKIRGQKERGRIQKKKTYEVQNKRSTYENDHNISPELKEDQRKDAKVEKLKSAGHKKQCCRKECRKHQFDSSLSKKDTKSLKKFVEKYVEVAKCMTQSADRGRLRNARRIYQLPGSDNQSIKVCKTAFMETLKISSDFIDCALKHKTGKVVNGETNEQLESVQYEEIQMDNKKADISELNEHLVGNHDLYNTVTTVVHKPTVDIGDYRQGYRQTAESNTEIYQESILSNIENQNDMVKDANKSTFHRTVEGKESISCDTTQTAATNRQPFTFSQLPEILSESERTLTSLTNVHSENIHTTKSVSSIAPVYVSPTDIRFDKSTDFSRAADVPALRIYNQNLHHTYPDVYNFHAGNTQNINRPIAKVAPSPGYIVPNSPMQNVHQLDASAPEQIHPIGNQTPMFDINNPQLAHSGPFTSMLLEPGNRLMDSTYYLNQQVQNQHLQMPVSNSSSVLNQSAQREQYTEDDNEELIDVDSVHGNFEIIYLYVIMCICFTLFCIVNKFISEQYG